MKKYVLIRMATGQICIVDNNTALGKKRADKLISLQGQPIGYIESEYNPDELMNIFNEMLSNLKMNKDKED